MLYKKIMRHSVLWKLSHRRVKKGNFGEHIKIAKIKDMKEQKEEIYLGGFVGKWPKQCPKRKIKVSWSVMEWVRVGRVIRGEMRLIIHGI